MLHKKALGIAFAAWMALSGCTFTVQPESGVSGDATPAAQAETTEPSAEVTPGADTGEKPVGEAAAMDNELVGTTWQWVETAYGDGSVVTVADPSRYTLTFNDDGTLSAQVDCNGGSGNYTLDGASLTLSPLVTTRMGCPAGSQGSVFTKDLEAVASYVIEDGNLHLSMAMDSGIMEFAPAQ